MSDARARIHAMLPVLDGPAEADARETELDKHLNALVAAALHQAADHIDRAQNRLVVKKTVVNILRRRASQAGEETTAPAATATPDFFQVGHAYTHRHGYDFLCVAVTTHPVTRERLAIGWHSEDGAPIAVGINQWNHEYDGVQAPTSTEGGAE